jgi:DNA mismatch repair protein MutS
MAKGTGSAASTPVMRQYLAAKAGHPDALVLFRLGDFYELFFDDATIAARVLDLTLTSRNKGADDEIPMAGVPYHAASAYIQKLVEHGYKVALCEQMGDPSTTKGIVPREVVRVVSPGIAYDDAGVDARQNHYLVAVEGEGATFGVAALDMTTGELAACEAHDAATALAEIVRLDPREVLVAPNAGSIADALAESRGRAVVRPQSRPLDDGEADGVLDALFGPGEARASCTSRVARRAAARCVGEARASEVGRPLPIARLVAYELGDTLLLDDATQAHLELVRTLSGEARGALLGEIDATRTSAGARLLRRRILAPRTDVATIRRRLDAVELFVTHTGLRNELRDRLGQVGDLERLAVKLAFDRASPRDLVSLRASLGELPAIGAALSACPEPSARDALQAPPGGAWIDECSDAHALLARAVADDPPSRASDGGVVRDGYDAALDEARMLAKDGQRLILELEARLREESLIPSLKLRYTRVFGWYIEVTRTHLDKAPSTWRRKQTIATGERFTCDPLDALADKLAHAEERAAAREGELYVSLVRELAGFGPRFREVAARLAEWDVSSALAQVAHRDDWCRPDVDASFALEIEDGRHPVVEKLAAAGRFVPNDVALSASDDAADRGMSRLWLVTGPNMAGKSTLMRQVALITILAQAGSFVPARRARVGVVDRVLTRVGASDNLARGESTFMVEMKETANVLRRATRRSLVVLDEIGRGTSTYDGLAIAWAVAEYLHDAVGCRAMFATHYHELTELAATLSACENWSVSAREHAGEIVFLHKLQRGAASRSYGVACARLAGVPEIVLARAKQLLAELERGGGVGHGQAPPARPQLDLFGAKAPPAVVVEHPALELLRAVDVDRMTPLEALQLVESLRRMARTKGGERT